MGLLESALGRPQHLATYGAPDAADLAAAYGYGLCRHHPFIDGNKRTGFVAIELFLALNGHELEAGDVDCVMVMLATAAGDIEESVLSAWIRKHLARR